ncbi:Riboflavin kinase / FMN adenylyltransferase [Leptospirillum ferriphilum]|uniref:FAD synthase n=1 Tax=Leptospirillum ferriphilum TaxID=178606 RepID=A0A094W8R8_9BACT|nr:Riboflavin kinase / FMN adenylyltransferase [Leptospirillum ferriphilum]
MNIFSSFSEMNTVRESGQEISLTIGNFDGIHQGHQKLLNDLVEYSRKTKTLATVLTFDPHPLMVLSPEIPFQRIMSIPHKKKSFRNWASIFLSSHPSPRTSGEWNRKPLSGIFCWSTSL